MGRRPRDGSPDARFAASLRDKDGDADVRRQEMRGIDAYGNLKQPAAYTPKQLYGKDRGPRLHSPTKPRMHEDCASIPNGPDVSIHSYVGALSNGQVAQQLEIEAGKNGVSKGTTTLLKHSVARKLLESILLRNAVAKVDEEKYERTCSPAKQFTRPEAKVSAWSPAHKKQVQPTISRGGVIRAEDVYRSDGKKVPPVVKELLAQVKAKGFHESYFFRQVDLNGSNQITKKEFEKGCALVNLSLQASEIKTVFDFFDATGDGAIDFAEFTSVMSDDSALTQPRWNTEPPKRYRADEERHDASKKEHEETLVPTGYGALASARQYEKPPHKDESQWTPLEAPLQDRQDHPSEAPWTPRSDLGKTVLEDRPVQSRWTQANEGTVAGKWMGTLRASDSGNVGMQVPTRPEPHSLDGELGQAHIVGTVLPSEEERQHPRPNAGIRFASPPQRFKGEVTAQPVSPPRKRVQSAISLKPGQVAADEDVGTEVFGGVPKDQGRIKSHAEVYMAKKASQAKRQATKELQQYNAISDLAKDDTRACLYSGPASTYAEWQRAAYPGVHGATATDNMPPGVQTIIKRLKAAGFTDCYFFRMIDKDATGLVTSGDFENGLALLKIEMPKAGLRELYEHFDSDNDGRINYHNLQQALNVLDGSRATKPRFTSKGPTAPIAGPKQFSAPGGVGDEWDSNPRSFPKVTPWEKMVFQPPPH